MIALQAQVTVGVTQETGTVVGRVTAFGAVNYMVRFSDGRVRQFASRYVSVAVAPVERTKPRLVVDNTRAAPCA